MSVESRSHFGTSLQMLTTCAATAALSLLVASGLGQLAGRRALLSYRAPSDSEAIASYAAQYAAESTEADEVVFLGDSTALAGIQPALFEKSSGLRAHVLGSTCMTGIDWEVGVLQVYLAHHPPPRLLVFTTSVFNWGKPCRWDQATARFLREYAPALAVPHTSDFLETARLGIWSAYGWMTGGAKTRLREQMDGRVPVTAEGLINRMRESRGYLPGGGVYLPPQTMQGSSPVKHRPFEPAERNQAGLAEIARVADDARVPLLIQFAPVYADAQEENYLDPLEPWLQELEKAHPMTTVEHPLTRRYDGSLFVDETHLSPRGAEEFTTFLAQEVPPALELPVAAAR